MMKIILLDLTQTTGPSPLPITSSPIDRDDIVPQARCSKYQKTAKDQGDQPYFVPPFVRGGPPIFVVHVHIVLL